MIPIYISLSKMFCKVFPKTFGLRTSSAVYMVSKSLLNFQIVDSLKQIFILSEKLRQFFFTQKTWSYQMLCPESLDFSTKVPHGYFEPFWQRRHLPTARFWVGMFFNHQNIANSPFKRMKWEHEKENSFHWIWVPKPSLRQNTKIHAWSLNEIYK